MNVAEWLAASARLRPSAPALLRGAELKADYATFAHREAAIGSANSMQGAFDPATGSAFSRATARNTLSACTAFGGWARRRGRSISRQTVATVRSQAT
jgi:hypothetical protein